MFGDPASAQRLLQDGFQRLQAGRVEEAWTLFHEVLRLDPRNALAHHMVGLIALQAGELETGVEAVRRAIALDPNDPVAHGNLASGLRDLGRTDEALAAYKTALSMAPDFVDALNNRGVLLTRLGRHREALHDYDRALALQPGQAALHNNRADALAALGRADEALDGYGRAAVLDPHDPTPLYNRGNLLARVGRKAEAAADLQRAVELRSDFVEALVNLGNVLQDLDRRAEALAAYDRALALDPGQPYAASNRADALRGLGRHAEALESCEAALRMDPACADAWLNRATVLGELGRMDEALLGYQQALRLQPGRPEAELNAGTACLALGRYEEGWRLYEARWRMPPESRFVVDRGFDRPRWTGEEPLAGKTLLLHTEQGLGDSLQFCRYAALASRSGARVVLEAEAPLVALFRTLAGVDEVVEKGAPLPRFDLHCPLMSLPWAFGSTLRTVPAEVPYLRADPDKARVWAERLGAKTRPRVGLVWSGGFRPNQPHLWSVHRRRNLPLAELAPLARADVEFHSLQKGEPAESELRELAARGWAGPRPVDHAQDLHDFSDTAALIEALDLVIAVDTSTAHLAGALGKPVWILNRFDSCWRWMLERTDSPWYPTARLFRQQTFGDWAPVIGQVAEALAEFRP